MSRQMIITYTLNFLDKNALSNSANYGLKKDNVCRLVLYNKLQWSLVTDNARSISLAVNIAGPAAPYSISVSLGAISSSAGLRLNRL